MGARKFFTLRNKAPIIINNIIKLRIRLMFVYFKGFKNTLNHQYNTFHQTDNLVTVSLASITSGLLKLTSILTV